MGPQVGDPRLLQPQCSTLTPVETVHRNPWFAVRKRGDFYAVEYNSPQVVILPVVDGSSLVMVRVKRPLLADSTLELPAGGALEREPLVQAAARELAEESGIAVTKVSRFKALSPLSVTPRYPLLSHIFRIDLTRKEYESRNLHDDEIDSVECLEFPDVLSRIVEGEIYLSLPIAIIARFCLLADLKSVKDCR